MSGPATDGNVITALVSDSGQLVNPDGTGTVQFRQFLRSLKRVGTAVDPAVIAALQAQVTALQAQVTALQTLSTFLLEVEDGP